MKFVSKIPASVEDAVRNATVPWGPVGYVTYKRTYARMRADLGRSEEWADTALRGIQALLDYGMAVTEGELADLADAWVHLKGIPAGRGLWQLGTDTVRKVGSDSLQNCWYAPLSTPEAFCFLFDELMLGGGVGFSVMPSHVHKLPPVKRAAVVTRKDTADVDFLVPDNRQGWVELLRRVLAAFFETGKDFTYSCQAVRSKGAPIAGFGGTASGPEELSAGVGRIAAVLGSRAGKHVRPIDALDIANIIGSVVVAGNVRRSAQIAIGHVEDADFLSAKRWDLGGIPNWRAMSNNTVGCGDTSRLPDSFWLGYEGTGEPYGLFNLDLSRSHGRLADGPNYREDRDVEGVNPCVTADAWVHTSAGPRRVADLVGVPFDAVVDGAAHRSEGFFQTGVMPVLKLTTSRGYSVRLTGNHLVRVVTKQNQRTQRTEWRPASDIRAGDSVVLHDHRGFSWGGEGTGEEGWLLGSLLGDGHFTGGRAKLQYWGETKGAMLGAARHALRSSVACRSDSGAALATAGTAVERDTLSLGSVGLRALAGRFGLGPDKVIGDPVERGSSEFCCGFLRGWFDADGSVTGNRVNGVSVRLSSVILGNLLAAQRMLARVGVGSTVYRERRPEGTRPMPDGRGGVKGYFCQAMHELVISGDNLAAFAEAVGFEDEAKRSALRERLGAYGRRLKRERFAAVVESVTPDGVEPVYDCTVPGPAAFDGNGLYLHNCAEQTLAPWECCCLVEQMLPNIRDLAEFHRVASAMYKVAKTMISLPLAWPKTREVVEKNRRVGISVTGVAQSSFGKDDYSSVYRHLEELDRDYSRLKGVNRSIKLTTVKPSGTVSLLAGVTPGVHPAYAQQYIRRIRFASDDPLADRCRRNGYHVEPVVGFDGKADPNTLVAEFPVRVPEGTLLASRTTAVRQLELQKSMQTYWSDNAVSVTVYYRKEELPAVKGWLAENYRQGIKTTSFLLHSEHGFRQAPYEEISRERYEELAARARPVTSLTETEERELADSTECRTGACPVK